VSRGGVELGLQVSHPDAQQWTKGAFKPRRRLSGRRHVVYRENGGASENHVRGQKAQGRTMTDPTLPAVSDHGRRN
jgi:hypothetical protein